jgi:hypothetical protein
MTVSSQKKSLRTFMKQTIRAPNSLSIPEEISLNSCKAVSDTVLQTNVCLKRNVVLGFSSIKLRNHDWNTYSSFVTSILIRRLFCGPDVDRWTFRAIDSTDAKMRDKLRQWRNVVVEDDSLICDCACKLCKLQCQCICNEPGKDHSLHVFALLQIFHAWNFEQRCMENALHVKCAEQQLMYLLLSITQYYLQEISKFEFEDCKSSLHKLLLAISNLLYIIDFCYVQSPDQQCNCIFLKRNTVISNHIHRTTLAVFRHVLQFVLCKAIESFSTTLSSVVQRSYQKQLHSDSFLLKFDNVDRTSSNTQTRVLKESRTVVPEQDSFHHVYTHKNNLPETIKTETNVEGNMLHIPNKTVSYFVKFLLLSSDFETNHVSASASSDNHASQFRQSCNLLLHDFATSVASQRMKDHVCSQSFQCLVSDVVRNVFDNLQMLHNSTINEIVEPLCNTVVESILTSIVKNNSIRMNKQGALQLLVDIHYFQWWIERNCLDQARSCSFCAACCGRSTSYANISQFSCFQRPLAIIRVLLKHSWIQLSNRASPATIAPLSEGDCNLHAAALELPDSQVWLDKLVQTHHDNWIRKLQHEWLLMKHE